MKKAACFLLAIFLLGTCPASLSAVSLDDQWDALSGDIDARWEDLERQQDALWKKLEAEVEKKWQTFVHSTQTAWVDYDEGRDTRSSVDFENGEIVLETVVEDNAEGTRKAKELLRRQATAIFQKEGKSGYGVLDGQVVDRDGNAVSRNEEGRFIKKELIPAVRGDNQPYRSKDGLTRRRYSTRIAMVPNHIDIRARKYLSLVEKNARRFRLKPQLILAVIHTESYFNPLAVSHCGAIGLMQIIPRYAGKEAYRYVYHQDGDVSREYLYDPANNVELGAAYLYLLRFRHFNAISNDLKNLYLSICGYNWGPHNIKRKIIRRHPIDSMSENDVYLLLRQRTPNETKNYIKRVVERMPIYDNYYM